MELKRHQDSLKRQIDSLQEQICELVDPSQTLSSNRQYIHDQSFGAFNRDMPPDSAKIREIDHDLKIQIDRAFELKQKCAQSYDNIDKLTQLQNQIAEEILMTQEDKCSQ